MMFFVARVLTYYARIVMVGHKEMVELLRQQLAMVTNLIKCKMWLSGGEAAWVAQSVVCA